MFVPVCVHISSLTLTQDTWLLALGFLFQPPVFGISQWCRLARVSMSGLMTRDIPRQHAICVTGRRKWVNSMLRAKRCGRSLDLRFYDNNNNNNNHRVFSRSASRAPSLFSTENRTCAHCLVACSSFSETRVPCAHYCPLGTESDIFFFLNFFFYFHSLSQTYSSSSSVHRTVTVTHTDDVTPLTYY